MYKLFLLSVFSIASLSVLKASNVPIMNIAEITNQMFDLDGKTVEIRLDNARAGRQVSKDEYMFNIGTEAFPAIVYIPIELGRKWFARNSYSSTPRNMYVRVTHGQLVSTTYGGSNEGLILIGLGTRVEHDGSGNNSYSW